MLVLRNGEVLRGRITLADEVYVVDLPDGQIRVRRDVEVVCRDLEDGYRRKRAAIQIGNVHHHLELAQWCLHHNLLGPAAVELADARWPTRGNPMIAVLQRRLKMALEPPTPRRPRARRRRGHPTTNWTGWSAACRESGRNVHPIRPTGVAERMHGIGLPRSAVGRGHEVGADSGGQARHPADHPTEPVLRPEVRRPGQPVGQPAAARPAGRTARSNTPSSTSTRRRNTGGWPSGWAR